MLKYLYFTGGSFYKLENYFHCTKGVTRTRLGYVNSLRQNPKICDVECGLCCAAYCVEIAYDTLQTPIQHLVDLYLGYTKIQTNDQKIQYRNGIFSICDEDNEIVHHQIHEYKQSGQLDKYIECSRLENFFEAESALQCNTSTNIKISRTTKIEPQKA